MKKILPIIVLSVGIPALIICGLFWWKQQNKQHGNGFVRSIQMNAVAAAGSCMLDNDTYYIAGLTKDHIFLCNYANPEDLLGLDYTRLHKKRLHLFIPQQIKIAWRMLKCALLNDQIVAYEGQVPNIFEGKLQDRLLNRLPVEGPRFDVLSPLSAGSYALRQYDPATGFLTLSKKSVVSGRQSAPLSLGNQQDGVFSVDGYLGYDASAAQVVYTFSYRNQFICLDTNMQVISRCRTIDTFAHAVLRIDTIASKNKTMLSAPPLLVNKRCSVDHNVLFIHSALMADNEKGASFEQAPVIDMYTVPCGQYKGSFYLFPSGSNHLSDLKVFHNYLVTIQDKTLRVYHLSDAL